MKYYIFVIISFLFGDKLLFRIKHLYLHLKKGGKIYWLNFKNPVTFNEKINWLKKYPSIPNGNLLADKVEVRKYIKEKVGDQYLIPSLGIFEDANEIDFGSLPDKFVIKTNHGSGFNIICNSKKDLNVLETRRKLNNWLKQNYFYYGREWQYKNIKPRLIIEKHLLEDNNFELLDYKFFCFDGEPKYIQIDTGRFSTHKRQFLTTKWNLLDFTVLYEKESQKIKQPIDLGKMLEISKKLSEGLIFARIDLYSINSKIYFGEITLHPGGGSEPFFPFTFDKELGKKLILPLPK